MSDNQSEKTPTVGRPRAIADDTLREMVRVRHMPDGAIAAELGVTKRTVVNARRRLGLASVGPHGGRRAGAGSYAPDPEIAALLAQQQADVARENHEIRIPRHRGLSTRDLWAWAGDAYELNKHRTGYVRRADVVIQAGKAVGGERGWCLGVPQSLRNLQQGSNTVTSEGSGARTKRVAAAQAVAIRRGA